MGKLVHEKKRGRANNECFNYNTGSPNKSVFPFFILTNTIKIKRYKENTNYTEKWLEQNKRDRYQTNKV